MKWNKPQLIVIARGGTQESVLLICKAIGYEGVDVEPQAMGQEGCDQYDPGNCGACQDRSGGDS
jgi:hypothetical protein